MFIISIQVTDKLDILPSDDSGVRATLKTESAFSCCLCVFVLLTEAGGWLMKLFMVPVATRVV